MNLKILLLSLLIAGVVFFLSPILSTTIRVFGQVLGMCYLQCFNKSFYEVVGLIWYNILNPTEKIFGELASSCSVNNLMFIHITGIILEGIIVFIVGLYKRVRWFFLILLVKIGRASCREGV